MNGQKEDAILVSEKYINELPLSIRDSIEKTNDKTFVLKGKNINHDTTYVYKNGTVKIYSGKQKADGLLPTCKSTLMETILPLIAYLAFFCV